MSPKIREGILIFYFESGNRRLTTEELIDHRRVDVKYSNRKDVIVSEHIAPFSVAMHGHQEGAGGGSIGCSSVTSIQHGFYLRNVWK